MAYRWLGPEYFAFGAAFSAVAAILVIVAIVLRRGGSPPVEPTRATGRAVAWGLVVFVTIFLSRFLLLDDVIFGSFVYQDEALETCIKPLQQRLGLPIWAGVSKSIVSSINWLTLQTFGFHATLLRSLPAVWFALGVGLLTTLLYRPLGAWVVLTTVALLAVSYPFVLHSVWATIIPWGALPALALYALLLGMPRVSPAVAVVAGLLTGSSLYFYPGATIAMVPAIALHWLLFRDRWSSTALVLTVVSALAAKTGLDFAYQEGFRTGYGGGRLSVKYLGEAMRTTPADFFFRSTSFDVMNLGAPVFEPVFFWTLLLACFAPTRLLALGLGTFVLNVVATGFTGAYPGARRALWSLPLLYLVCVHGVLLLGRRRRAGGLVKGLLLLSLALVGTRTLMIARSHFPIYPDDRLFEEMTRFVASRTPLPATLVVLKNPRSEFRSHEYWCALTFDAMATGAGALPVVLRKDRLFAGRRGAYWVLMQPDDTPADLAVVFGTAPRTPLPTSPGVPAVDPAPLLRVVQVTMP